MAKVEISSELCKSCLFCVNVCPKKCLEVGKEANGKGYMYVFQARPEDCIGCALCAEMCPDACIEVYK